MAISGQYKSNINQSDDSVDYGVGFHRDALFLIIAGHKRLTEKAADYSNEEEPNITGELVHYTREYIEAPDACEWAYRYAVHDDPPELENTLVRKGLVNSLQVITQQVMIQQVCWGIFNLTIVITGQGKSLMI